MDCLQRYFDFILSALKLLKILNLENTYWAFFSTNCYLAWSHETLGLTKESRTREAENQRLFQRQQISTVRRSREKKVRFPLFKNRFLNPSYNSILLVDSKISYFCLTSLLNFNQSWHWQEVKTQTQGPDQRVQCSIGQTSETERPFGAYRGTENHWDGQDCQAATGGRKPQ